MYHIFLKRGLPVENSSTLDFPRPILKHNSPSELINNQYIDILQLMIAPLLIGSGINSLNLKEISNLNKAIRPKYSFYQLENEIIVNLFLNS